MHTVRELSKEVDLHQNRAALVLHGASSKANSPGLTENLGQTTSGYGVVVRFPCSTENDEILGPCSGMSNYVAEMVAIQNAVESIEERLNEKTSQPSPIVLFTDSLSCLQAIESSAGTLPEPLAKTLACAGRLQEKRNIRTTLQYIPGHVGVEGKADLLAKFGTKTEPCERAKDVWAGSGDCG
nr:hypothetical protein BgiMline_010313 [Biomphalaria glabrata]